MGLCSHARVEQGALAAEVADHVTHDVAAKA
jgi:hypothetical protein